MFSYLPDPFKFVQLSSLPVFSISILFPKSPFTHRSTNSIQASRFLCLSYKIWCHNLFDHWFLLFNIEIWNAYCTNTFKYHVSCTDGKISVRIILITYFFTTVPLTNCFISYYTTLLEKYPAFFLWKLGGFQWSALEPSYTCVNFFPPVDGKQHLSEVFV